MQKINHKNLLFFCLLLVCNLIIYVVLAKLGLILASIQANVSPVWPASGFAVGVLSLFGKKFWPAIFLGAFFTNFFFTPATFSISIFIGIGNCLEALVASWIIHNILNLKKSLGYFAQPAGIILGAILGSCFSATVGVGALFILQDQLVSFWPMWLTWWVGDCLGILLLTPLIFALHEVFFLENSLESLSKFKLCVLMVFLNVLGFTLFIYPTQSALLFLVFPLMLLGTICCGYLGASVSAFLIAVYSVLGTAIGNGPFIGNTLNDSFLFLQLFLASVALTALLLPVFKKMGHLYLPGVVLVVGWLLSGWMFASLSQIEKEANQVHLDNLISQAEHSILERMSTYEDALRGGASLYAASNDVTWKEWQVYVEASKILERYPGIHGLGVVRPVLRSQIEERVKELQKEIGINFRPYLVPDVIESERPAATDTLYLISYIVPLEFNSPALGLDLSSEPSRKLAADESRDTGELVMTSAIQLVQDSKKRKGFLVYVPMYQNQMSLKTIEERRRAFTGWIYAPFITEDFMSRLLVGKTKEVELFLFEGNKIDDQNLIYRSGDAPLSLDVLSRFDKVSHLTLGNRDFTLAWKKTPLFLVANNTGSIWAAACSALLSLILAGLIVSLQSLESRARNLAQDRTIELQNQIEETKASTRKLHQAREQLFESQKVEAIGKLAGGIAHDFNNILAAILGYADLLKRQLTQNDQAMKNLNVIISSAERGANLTKEILGFARKGQYELKVLDINASLVEAIHILEASIGKNISIKKHFADSVWCIAGDSTQILQVLLNLGINARDAMPKGGQISIFTDNVEVGVESVYPPLPQGRYVRVRFIDTGTGIPRDIQTQIFDPFFTTKEHGKGSGLGLSMAYGIMKNHGGIILLHSSSTNGTIFDLYFPAPQHLVEKEQIATPKPALQSAILKQIQGKKVLVVDDEEYVLSSICEVLQMNGMKVLRAENGKKAIEQLKTNANEIDVVVLDVVMPEMSGIQVYQEMQRCSMQIPVIFSSGYAEGHEMIAVRKSGQVQFIQKPYIIENLIESIAKSLLLSSETV